MWSLSRSWHHVRIAAAIGKVGAFSGNYAYPVIQADLGSEDSNIYYAGPFYIAGGLAIFSAIITFLFIPNIGQDSMKKEDEEFRQYLIDNGYDVSQMGLMDADHPGNEQGAGRTHSDSESMDNKEKKADEPVVSSAAVN